MFFDELRMQFEFHIQNLARKRKKPTDKMRVRLMGPTALR